METQRLRWCGRGYPLKPRPTIALRSYAHAIGVKVRLLCSAQLLKARVAAQRSRDCCVFKWISLLVCLKTAAGQQLLCREENKERRQL